MADDREPRHIIIPGLPNPYEGVTDEITEELTEDPQGFTTRVLTTMDAENPHLGVDIQATVTTSPFPSLSLSSYAAYYEIFSRSARREGIPMMVVSKDTSDSLIEEHLINGDLSDEEIDEHAKGKINRDVQRSSELAKFWNYLNAVGMTLVDRYSPVDRYRIFLPILTLQETFQRQEEINNQLQASSFNRTNGGE